MLLDALRILSMLVWGSVAVSVSMSVYRAVTRRTYANDNFRSGYFFVGLLMLGFGGRWYLAPDDEATFTALYALSCLGALYALVVVLAHGRGSHG